MRILLLALLFLFDQQNEAELQNGISLTRQGQFSEAIPHFLAARGHVSDAFALEFNLALCYTGTRAFTNAIEILGHVSQVGHEAQVNALLAQALIGDQQATAAEQAFRKAAAASPGRESMYVLIAEAAQEQGFDSLAGEVVDTGLRNVPASAKLFFERGWLRFRADDAAGANADFATVEKSAPGSDIAYIAKTEEALLAGDVPGAIRSAREGVTNGRSHYLLLTLLGEALLRGGATPGTPQEFQEAQEAFERAVALQPRFAGAQIGLGKIYLAKNEFIDAIAHLERARGLEPSNRALYPPLAQAFRLAGQTAKAQETLAALEELNRAEAARIGSAKGGHAGYVH